MKRRFVRALVLTAALALSGCGSLEDIAPKAERPLPERISQIMEAKGMERDSPIMMRIFKEEGVLEVWKQTRSGRYQRVTSYDICKWSGKLGPKFTEGDRQAPEGFYTVRPHQMNPQSNYHLAFNIGYPNAYDRANGRTGKHLMVHGACSSAGCYSMTDEQVEEIYAFARDAFRGGQQAFQLQAYPFRMTPANMARYRNDPNYPFWKMLKEGYDYFEITRMPPKVDVCERRYVFNRMAADGYRFEPTEACPPSTQPSSLLMAYQSHQKEQEIAFWKAIGVLKKPAPGPSIQGLKEASLVADWSRRRANGERVSAEPPSLAAVAEPVPASAPVAAYASTGSAASSEVTCTVSQAQSTLGAPTIQARTLPLPEPSPQSAEAEPAPATPSPGRFARLRAMIGQ